MKFRWPLMWVATHEHYHNAMVSHLDKKSCHLVDLQVKLNLAAAERRQLEDENSRLKVEIEDVKAASARMRDEVIALKRKVADAADLFGTVDVALAASGISLEFALSGDGLGSPAEMIRVTCESPHARTI